MIPDDTRNADVQRVRWLCSASPEIAREFCLDAAPADPAEVHCARFAMHIAMNAPLPDGYAWRVLLTTWCDTEENVYLAPAEAHVGMLAMYAADLDRIGPIPLHLWTSNDPFLQPIALFRLARSLKALDNERVLELSYSNVDDVRRAVAKLLKWRRSPQRVEILMRLIDDPCRRVSGAASYAAAQTGDPQLLDRLASKQDLFSLNLAGDPRGRPRIEALANSDDVSAREEAGGMALILGDRSIVEKLRKDSEWAIRSDMILASARKGFIDSRQLDQIVAQESPTHVAELVVRWPQSDAETLSRIAAVLRTSVDGFPDTEAVAAGRTDASDRVRAWIATEPRLCGAMLRLLPVDVAGALAQEMLSSPVADARAVAIEAVAFRSLTECIPLVAEACLDPDDLVARTAARAVYEARVRCGLYGLDTAILGAGDDLNASIAQRRALLRLLIQVL